ncbi:MAG: hypothetical protein AAGA78_12040, partial [Pseudomonadota bacterium]
RRDRDTGGGDRLMTQDRELETMERVLGNVDKIIIDEGAAGGNGGQGVVPYLPLNELRRAGGSN